MQFIFEIIFRNTIRVMIQSVGMFIAWLGGSCFRLISGKKVEVFKNYSRRVERDRDPSNLLSYGIMHGCLGAAAFLGFFFLLAKLFE